MEKNYIIILDFSVGEVIRIKLDQELILAKVGEILYSLGLKNNKGFI